MSIATAAASCAAPAGPSAELWISLAEASRVSGLHETTVLRLALAGDVRHRTRGLRTVFHAEDVRRVAS